ncbi:hypothetical protein TIFTF001_033750 [Ficus carica]|uniref:FBD domain-containing protein n=1 Tax=Ficus carica TaxID=3494 RepID=A0AA88E2M0_FICCA|nr:hypothetical protein TIFTF001_033750 [Ficus carica]
MEAGSAKKRRIKLSITMIIMIPNDNGNHNNDQMITTDRISELPNDLHRILSLLPIKTQWDRDLWDMSTSSEEELYMESQTVTLKSFLDHLKMVTIHGFLECENEVSLTKFLLKRGKALQEMTVRRRLCYL